MCSSSLNAHIFLSIDPRYSKYAQTNLLDFHIFPLILVFLCRKNVSKKKIRTFFVENFPKNFRNLWIFIFEIDFPKKNFRFFLSRKIFFEIENFSKMFSSENHFLKSKFQIFEKKSENFSKKVRILFFENIFR